ncbi:mucin-6-like [Ixodes scapularis]
MKTLVLATAFAAFCLAAHVAAERDLLPTLKWPPEPGQCGTGEVWKECVSGSCAEKSCRRRQVGPGCTLDCRYGCYCADGFYRNADGACVTIDECPPGEQDQSQPLLPLYTGAPRPRRCNAGEVWKECASSSCAEKSCTRRHVGPGCTLDCRYDCFCDEGFYRNADGACVTADQCPPGEKDQSQNLPGWPFQIKPCEEGEVWKRCVSSSCAEETCERPVPRMQCTADCRHGCYCGEGFYRNSAGRCVPLAECPQAQVEEATQDID